MCTVMDWNQASVKARSTPVHNLVYSLRPVGQRRLKIIEICQAGTGRGSVA